VAEDESMGLFRRLLADFVDHGIRHGAFVVDFLHTDRDDVDDFVAAVSKDPGPSPPEPTW
jgi:hypothetical protein